jgi:hypothetical protein
VGSKPFDEHDLVSVINSYNQPIAIALDIEDHSVGTDDTGIRIGSQNICRLFPVGSEHFVKPCVHRCLDRLLVLAAFEPLDELLQSFPGN